MKWRILFFLWVVLDKSTKADLLRTLIPREVGVIKVVMHAKGNCTTLEAEVAALRERVEQLAETRVLPPPTTPERIDRALEVEMQAASDDGVMDKAARWLERWLRRK